MLILVVEPGKVPKIREISGSLEEMQSIVGGYIQITYPFADGVAVVCNDEGKLLKLPPNRGLCAENGELYDVLCGTFFVCGAPADCDHLDSLTPEQVEKFSKWFHSPQVFIGMDGHIICVSANGEIAM